MKVKDLIAELQGYPDDMEVHIAQPSHNHWRHVAAPTLEHAGQCDVAHSEYLRQPQILAEDFDPEDQDGKPAYVVILADCRETVDL